MIILRTTDQALIAAIICLAYALRIHSTDLPADQNTPIEVQPASWNKTLPSQPANPAEEHYHTPISGWF